MADTVSRESPRVIMTSDEQSGASCAPRMAFHITSSRITSPPPRRDFSASVNACPCDRQQAAEFVSCSLTHICKLSLAPLSFRPRAPMLALIEQTRFAPQDSASFSPRWKQACIRCSVYTELDSGFVARGALRRIDAFNVFPRGKWHVTSLPYFVADTTIDWLNIFAEFWNSSIRRIT